MLGVINRMAKKFNYKLPSMVALTLVGSAVTAHQVQAAETTQDQTTNKNVLDSNKVKATTEQAKAEVKNPTQNISGTQVYQDPAIVQPKAANKTGNAQVNQKVDTTLLNLLLLKRNIKPQHQKQHLLHLKLKLKLHQK